MIPRFALLLALAVTAAGCGRVHTLHDGTYRFAIDSVIRDDCNLAQLPTVTSNGTIKTTGHVVSMDYRIFNTPIQMVGNYLTQDFSPTDRMRLDGSAANVSTTINNLECLIDRVALHLDSTTTNASAFAGTFSINLDSARHNECVCQFWFNYTADVVP